MIPARRHLPLLLILFFGSGCAALIYEIVWFQLLQLVIGSTAVSLGTILATFMGGMCLGSLMFSRPGRVGRHPLRTYGWLELGIGLCGIVILFSVPSLGKFYADYVGYGPTASIFRATICAVCLLPPTLLIGATLPAISRSLKAGRSSTSWMGLFYGANIVGAVCGCLLAGFYLLRVHNMAIATVVAVSINVGVGLAALVLARFTPPHIVPDDAEVPELPDAGLNTARVHLTIALSGVAALGAEVVWTRQLSLVFGGTVYTFSIVLAVFLLGLGSGSIAGSWMARSVQRPLLALGLCQIFGCLAIAWTSWAIAYALPYWPANVSDQFNPWRTFGVDLLRCFWALLPATCLWGASFPLALAQVGTARGEPGRAVGGLYAANTAGAILGAVVFSLIMIPWAGSTIAQQVIIGISALSSALVLLVDKNHRKWWISCLIVGISVVLAWSVPRLPGLAVAYGRSLPRWVSNPPDILYVGEGINSSVAVTEWPNGVRNFHVAGKVEASTEPKDMRLQRMLGHLSALAHPEPKSVLIVGFGAGITAGAFVLYPEVERIVICEIEPLIPQVVSTYFGAENYYVLNDPRVQVIYDDARHFLMTRASNSTSLHRIRFIPGSRERRRSTPGSTSKMCAGISSRVASSVNGCRSTTAQAMS